MMSPDLSRKAALFIFLAVAGFAIIMILKTPFFRGRAAGAPPERRSSATVQRGISLRADDVEDGGALEVPPPALRHEGINWVLLTVDLWMPASRHRRFEYSSQSLDRLRDAARQFRNDEIGVTLAPRLVAPDTGDAFPVSQNNAERYRAQVRDFLLEIADIAKATGAEAIAVPVELFVAVSDTSKIRRLLTDLKRRSGARVAVSLGDAAELRISGIPELDYLIFRPGDRSVSSRPADSESDLLISRLRSLAVRAHKRIVLDFTPVGDANSTLLNAFRARAVPASKSVAETGGMAAPFTAENWLLGAFVPHRALMEDGDATEIHVNPADRAAFERMQKHARDRAAGAQLELRQAPPARTP